MGKMKVKANRFEEDYSDLSFEEQEKNKMMWDDIIYAGYLSPQNNSDVEDNIMDEDDDGGEGFLKDLIANAVSPNKNISKETVVEKKLSPVVKDDNEPERKKIPIKIVEAEDAETPMKDLLREDLRPVKKDDTFIEKESYTKEVLTAALQKSQQLLVSSNVGVLSTSRVEEPMYDMDDEDDDDEDDEVLNINSMNDMIVFHEDTLEFLIRHPWREYQSHTISTYGLVELSTDYSAVNYTRMKELAMIPCMYLAGPSLIIKSGNDKFKEFIKKLVDVDKDKVMIVRYISDTDKDTNGNPAEDYLVYTCTDSSRDALNLAIDNLEANNMSIDFLYALYSRVIDRYSCPLYREDVIDGFLDASSQDEDIDFILQLIENDEGTKLGESNYEQFVENFVVEVSDILELARGFVAMMKPYIPESDDMICKEIPFDFIPVMESLDTKTETDPTTINIEYTKDESDGAKADVNIDIEDIDDDTDVNIDISINDTVETAMHKAGNGLIVPSIS